MGVYTRPDSKYFWLWLETAPKGQQRKRTDILIGATPEDRKASKQDATEAYHKIMLGLGRQRHGLPVVKQTIRFKAFALWYATHVIAHHKGKDREREILKVLQAAFDTYDLTEITKDRVLEWITKRKATKVKKRKRTLSVATVNRELDVLKQLLSAAVPTYLDANPIARMKRLKGVGTEAHVLSRTDETKLLAHLRTPSDVALVTLAIDSLMRLSDLLRLKREHDHGTYLTVVDPKTTPYKVPVSKRARVALDALPMSGPYFFGHRRVARSARDYRSAVKMMLARACARAKIDYGRGVGITFHGLRHTGATRMVEAGVSLRIVQTIGGWTSLRQLERYAHPSDAATLAAVNVIGPSTPDPLPRQRKPRRS